jgi:hypothetical protein
MKVVLQSGTSKDTIIIQTHDKSTVCWFIVREKYYWMAADLAEPAKRTG